MQAAHPGPHIATYCCVLVTSREPLLGLREPSLGLRPWRVCTTLQSESTHRVWYGALPSLHDPAHHCLQRLSNSLGLWLHALAASLVAGPAPMQQAQA